MIENKAVSTVHKALAIATPSLAILCLLFLLLNMLATPAQAQRVGTPSASDLVLVENKKAKAVIVVAADAGAWEKKAADDLRKYIGLMAGAEPEVVNALPSAVPALVVGSAAVRADRATGAALARVAKKHPVVQADAISVRRSGNRLYIAGANDEAHYFAVSWLLQQWGVRWYMPTDFGEVVPSHRRLTAGEIDFAYAPPFEIRHYWIAWNGDSTGAEEFRHRNFMSSATMPGQTQVLDRYTSALAPAGGSHFQVPFSADKTAEHVAAQIEADYAAGKDVSLAIADGIYASDHPGDRALIGEYDRYMLKPSLTDAMMTLYNNVGRILRRKYPESRAKIGGLAYVNVTLPPRKVSAVEPNIVMWIAPIDIDPNHAMDDPRSPPRQEYGAMVRRWSELLGGRLGIYDYDQGMLVWRDLPNPSHHVFARDAKAYARAGIVGIGTESRGALATVFLNLFFRGQLMWDPDADTAALLAEFYPKFYGPAAGPMSRYWGRIFEAWEKTEVTEHEYLAIPAIYTQALVDELEQQLGKAERSLERTRGVSNASNAAYRERMRFTRHGFEIIRNYVAMVAAAAGEADYPKAVAAGERAIAARLALAELNPLFATRVVGQDAETIATGAAFLPGEVDQMRNLAALTDGSKGRLIARLPLEWRFAREAPLAPDWTYDGPEGAAGAPETSPFAGEPAAETAGWRTARTDLYLQAQGILAADRQAALGHYWYQTSIDIDAADVAGGARILFPGLFNEAWLYVNGKKVAHRAYVEPWWQTDYRFEWDVDVTGMLKPGRNVIALRGFNPHHFGGMFRRPLLYAPLKP